MKLENEIKQKKFKSIHQKLMLNILYTSNWISFNQSVFFKDSGITLQQYNVLRILRGQYPNACSIKIIKERMLDRMSDASRIVDKLFTKKLVLRNECFNDRRNVDVIITDEGLELLKSLDHADNLAEQTFKALTSEEITTLNNLLDKLRD